MKVTIELETKDMIEGIGKSIFEAMQIPGKPEAVAIKVDPVKATPEPAKAESAEIEKPQTKLAPKKPTTKKPEPVEEIEPEAEPEFEKPKRTMAEIKELLTQFCMEHEGGAVKVQQTFKELGISKLSEASESQLATIAEKLGL